MSTATKIEWTRGDDGAAGATWNPVTGCTKVSEGCDHCYAETFAERWRGVPGHPFEQGFDVRLWPERLDLPLKKWRKRRRIVRLALLVTAGFGIFRLLSRKKRATPDGIWRPPDGWEPAPPRDRAV